jgi:hypothetical protein
VWGRRSGVDVPADRYAAELEGGVLRQRAGFAHPVRSTSNAREGMARVPHPVMLLKDVAMISYTLEASFRFWYSEKQLAQLRRGRRGYFIRMREAV